MVNSCQINSPCRRRSWLILSVLAGAILMLRGPFGRRVDASDVEGVASPRPVTPRGELSAEEESTIALFERVSPAVVHITSVSIRRDRFSLDLYKIPSGTGSGFIWDEDGYVVTNYHVIHNAQGAEVTLSDGSSWPAKAVGAEADKDIAVLKIDAPRELLLPIAIGTSGDLRVGQKVLAIGNPFGLDQTLTTGIISGLGREIESLSRRPIQGVIQTDAAINPGNSGGPLLDSAGRLVGMNTAIYSPSGAYAGVGFAVPVDVVNRVVPQLIKHGRVIKPGLGVEIAEDFMARQLRISRGVLILRINPGSGAEKAGLLPSRQDGRGRITLGDIIFSVDDLPVKDSNSLFRILDEHEIGDTVSVTVYRNGEEKDIDITLEALE